MSKTYTAFKAYGTDGTLRLVGGGTAPQDREIGRVEVATFPTFAGVVAFIINETAHLAPPSHAERVWLARAKAETRQIARG